MSLNCGRSGRPITLLISPSRWQLQPEPDAQTLVDGGGLEFDH
jgi:hypothetical protein